MDHLFICYSRKDQDLALKLKTALEQTGTDVWIDLDDLPASSIWRDEISDAITGAIAFIYLISIHSLASEYCQKEFEHAKQINKKIIPVLLPHATDKEIPEHISIYQWLNWNNFGENLSNLEQLTKDIETNLEWLKYHTGLQVKSAEWERNNRENGFLLHGKELQDAEIQLAANSSEEPYPTDLQREYVLRSRQETDKSRRRVTVGLISFSTLIFGLLIFAIFQLNISRARQLGFQSQVAFSEKDYVQAALFAYQSNQISDNNAAELTLGRVFYENFILPESITKVPTSVGYGPTALSPDGRIAFTKGDIFEEKIAIWSNGTSNTEISSITEIDAPEYIYALAWSPEGQLATVSGSDSLIKIWDIKSGTPIIIFPGTETDLGLSDLYRGPTILSWSPTGILASNTMDDKVLTIWNTNSGSAIHKLIGHETYITDVAWSNNGDLASASVDGVVYVWDIESEKPSKVLQGNKIAWSGDGRLASQLADGTIAIWDVPKNNIVQILKLNRDSSSRVSSLKWSPDGTLAAAVNKTVLVWDLKTQEPTHILTGHQDFVRIIEWKSSNSLKSYSVDGTAINWKLETPAPAQKLKSVFTSLGYPRFIGAPSKDGYLATVVDNNIAIQDIATGKIIQVLKGHTDNVTSISWSDDGRLASGSEDQTVIIWDIERGTSLITLKGHTSDVDSIDWNINGELASSSREVIIWDLTTGKPAITLSGSTSKIVWSYDGQLASFYGDSITIWNVISGKPDRVLKGHASSIQDIAWSIDGHLASSSWDNTIIIWDVEKGKAAQTLKKVNSSFTNLDWSSDSYLASQGASEGASEITIWDLSSRKPAHILKPTSRVYDIAWLSDGRLLSILDEGEIEITRGDLIRKTTCEWVNRNMTIEEWILYQGELFVYRPTCPDLPYPTFGSLLTDNPNIIGYTWPGRILLIAVFVFLIAILFFVVQKIVRKVFKK